MRDKSTYLLFLMRAEDETRYFHMLFSDEDDEPQQDSPWNYFRWRRREVIKFATLSNDKYKIYRRDPCV